MADSQQSNLSSGSKKHTRNISYGRIPLTRRSTRGPLDVDDPPAPSSPTRVATEAASVPLPHTVFSPEKSTHSVPSPPLLPPDPTKKDFSYLLRPENFHALTLKDAPPPFHTPPSHARTLALSSAHTLSTTPTLPPSQIFSHIYTRLASLTLLNLTPLAAAESKILEDIHSPFYRSPTTGSCILPWELRVLVVRLQAIASPGDLRRGVVGYYDLARDARAEVKKVGSGEEREVWRERLRGLGVCVGNALVEMGDLEGARRHFEVLRGDAGGKERRVLEGRLALLCLRIGDVRAARRYAGEGAMMEALLCMADGRYGDAVEGWRGMVAGERDVLARQNMAVCELYLGRMDETTEILDGLVEEGHSFHALTFNLATVYELCTERSRAKKMEFAERVAEKTGGSNGDEGGQARAERSNADFKL